MIGDYVRSIEGITTLGIVALTASMMFFIAIVIRTLRTPRERIDLYARLPFDDEQTVSSHHDEVVP
jgi:hypothetical protein